MAGLIGRRTRPLSPAGHAFVACLRAYATELAERGLVPDITFGDSATWGIDKTGSGNLG